MTEKVELSTRRIFKGKIYICAKYYNEGPIILNFKIVL